ncbi:MAG: hypothetical protein AAGI30_08430 [Planctomycetota bacterium]
MMRAPFLLPVILAALAWGGVMVASPGCQSAAPTTGVRTTLIQADDIIEITNSVRTSFASSPFFTSRSATSVPITIEPGRVTNVSNERLTGGDQRAMLTRVLYEPGIHRQLASRNIRLLRPTESPELLNQSWATYFSQTPPTHVLNAQFSSASRQAAVGDTLSPDARSDLFIVDYTLVELASRDVVWSDQFELKRFATGRTID